MPNIKSAKKRVLVNAKKAEQNKAIRSAVKTEIKKVDLLIKENKLEEAMVKLSDRIEYLDRKIAEISVEIDDRINSIELVGNVAYRDVLFKYYAEYKSFEQISVEMGYAYNYTCNLHGEALKELSKHLNFS